MKSHAKVSISLPAKLLANLRKRASKLGLTLSGYIALLLEGKIK